MLNHSRCEVDAYVFIQSGELPSSEQFVSILSLFKDAMEPDLTPIDDSLFLSNRVAKQSFVSTSDSIPDLRSLRQAAACAAFENNNSAEVVLLYGSVTPRPLKLAVFDMDSTLIDQEVIDELADSIGKKEAVREITERAMRGELDFAESLKERVTMLRGAREDVWVQLRSRITLAPGAEGLCQALRQRGVKTAVFSGGFQPMADWLKEQLKLDVAVANHEPLAEMLTDGQLITSPPTSEFPFSHLTGALDPDYPIISAAKKKDLLLNIAKEHDVPISQVMCVGDGANDLPMLQAVGKAGGVAVACRAKPRVQRDAPNRLNGWSLTDLIYLFSPNAIQK